MKIFHDEEKSGYKLPIGIKKVDLSSYKVDIRLSHRLKYTEDCITSTGYRLFNIERNKISIGKE